MSERRKLARFEAAYEVIEQVLCPFPGSSLFAKEESVRRKGSETLDVRTHSRETLHVSSDPRYMAYQGTSSAGRFRHKGSMRDHRDEREGFSPDSSFKKMPKSFRITLMNHVRTATQSKSQVS